MNSKSVMSEAKAERARLLEVDKRKATAEYYEEKRRVEANTRLLRDMRLKLEDRAAKKELKAIPMAKARRKIRPAS